MRDVQKGRKSWLERLTSPPESEGDDGFSAEPHPFERRLEAGPPPTREPKIPEGYEAFAPPGLRPPPSDDLKSAPPERSGDLSGPSFDQGGQRPAFESGPHPTFEPAPNTFEAGQKSFESGRRSFEPRDRTPDAPHDALDPKADEQAPPRPPLPAPSKPASHDAWKGPVTKPSRVDDLPTPASDESPRHRPAPLQSTSTPLSWQPDGPSLSSVDTGTNHLDLDLGPEPEHQPEQEPERGLDLADDDSLSRPSESEQLEAARKRHVDELQHRWLVTQAQILDDPRDAVREAGLLIGDAMQFVTSTFTDHRDRIEREWRHNDSMSTDELRMVMRRYRNLFQYVLSASQLPDL